MLALLLVLACCTVVVEAKRNKSKKTLADFFHFIKWIYLIVFLPAVVYFFWTILRDPATPGLLRELGKRLRGRFTTYLEPRGGGGGGAGGGGAGGGRARRRGPRSARAWQPAESREKYA